MMMRHHTCFLALAMCLPLAAVQAADSAKFTEQQVAFFTQSVAPVLKAHCLKCHGSDPKKLKGELDLRTRAAVMRGGETGPVVDLKTPAESLLLQAVNHSKDGYNMPPTGKLKDEDIRVLTKWVTDGVAFPPDQLGEEHAVAEPKKKTITDEQRKYWAYVAVKKPVVPTSAFAAPGGNPIDAFIGRKLDDKKLVPVGEAGKATLIRRAYYDLTGLPPTPKQIDDFVADTDPKAWERLIDALLASPHYGEKWGRHWLDIVRYAETNGYERDGAKPNAWRYRDYVIRSFNEDKPYNRFIREQIAGDELPRKDDEIDPVIATGFYRLGVWDDEPADPLQAQFDGYDDLVTITGQAFLGMTLNCARCHDHKGDPILQEDYYKFVSFFRDIREYSNDRNISTTSNQSDITPVAYRRTYEDELKSRTDKIAALTKAMVVIEDEGIKKMPGEDQRASEGSDRPKVIKKLPQFLSKERHDEYAKFARERDELRKKPKPNQQFALSVNNCEVVPPPTFINIRGNPNVNGAEVKPGFPTVLNLPAPGITPATKSSGRRTVLANWIADTANPMTARVFMNRVWQHHFGKGLVPTSNDFGKFGEGVTHPELLDWLASDFMEGGWTLKRMHRLMMTSAAYQRASTAHPLNMKSDPANTFLWRANMRRLNAEEVRDSILAVSGNLNLKTGGPSMYPKISEEVLAGLSFEDKKNHWPDSPESERNRRTIYAFVKRSLQVPILSHHDQADTDNSCPVRYTTTVPTQALGMLNGDFTNEQAAILARRLQQDAGGEWTAQVARGIRLTTGRVPTQTEVQADVAFIERLKAKHKLDDRQALVQFALLLLNANEFVYLD